MSAEFYQACVKDKQKSLLNPKSCEKALPEQGQQYPCSTLCPCSLRDQYIGLFEAHTGEGQADG